MTPDAATAEASRQTLAALVEALGGSGGDRPALVAFHATGMSPVSRADLAAAMRRTARALRARGIATGDRVALWAPNSADWVAAYFGIVLAGAAVVPLDFQATADSASAAIAHASPRLLVTTAARWAEIETRAAVTDWLLLDGGAPDHAWRDLRAPADAELPALTPDDLAALLYTSGTTGAPKAVPLTHGELAANAASLRAADLIEAHDRVLLPLPLHHTYPFTVGLLTVLGVGGAVILPAGLSGPELARAAREGEATALLAVPRLCEALWASILAGVEHHGTWTARGFRALLALCAAARRTTGANLGRTLFRPIRSRLGPRLTLIGCGGAKLPDRLGSNLEALGWTVLTGYGLTETAPVLTFNDRRHAKLGTEGRTLPGVEIKIATPAEGERHGEILARGPSVFKGYWHDAAETAAAFTPDGWFKTGDLGWLDADGFLHVVGRSKELLVLADGKKIFPEALEKLYAASPLVHEIAVLERNGALVALVVPDEQEVRKRGALREAALVREDLEDVGAKLAPYQRLRAYRITPTPLPRTQLGKLKRHQLAELYDASARPRSERRRELPEEDRRLLATDRARRTWQWLVERYPDTPLDLDTSPQLDLHIDSLEWVAITVELEQRLGVALSSEALARILTLRDLLREIEAAPTADEAPPRAPAVEFEPPGPALRVLGAALLLLVRAVMRVGFRLEVEGTEHLRGEEPLVITPNHASYLDPLALAAALPWRRLRRTYWAGWVGVLYTDPIRRFFARALQVFPVDPDRDLASALDVARDLTRRGMSVVWFPEGRRSPTGALEPFQAGVGRLLSDVPAAALPAAIHGTFAAWPKQRRLPRLARLHVAFGAARPLTEAERRGDSALIRRDLEHALKQLLQESAPEPHREVPTH